MIWWERLKSGKQVYIMYEIAEEGVPTDGD